MREQSLEVKAAIQIQKRVEEIFEAIVNPEIMKNYFISYSSGRMQEGGNLIWRFPEFDGDISVRVGTIDPNRCVSFYWDSSDGKELFVEINLIAQPDNSTVIRISETGMENNSEGIRWLISNTEGWANFLACMKAWLEYGIHLRNGAFDFMKNDVS